MTRSGHDEVMKRVMISELKAHLSEYVAAARRGETVIVCDRQTPVAKLEPLEYELTIREPTLPLEALEALHPVQLLKDVDVQAIHAEMREDRF
jgi:prevent-host-death family protein